ncbi:hypothetical protein [Yoonia sediminilitoris]|uniref:Lipoprotein n=1 Tax=Yoonia sediminilitoris TaxID=1286148 RepID=A0A2T6K5M5_9RHOB|nr:hypothetical protein [Yoonia sediminilitoris]PUB09966.1 hypothetical protein C8N45_12318 [Yoonia sediminilitoris]RCW89635.1 hypothetical protein DFP92_12318 [Yoonia sediminilitoris]
MKNSIFLGLAALALAGCMQDTGTTDAPTTRSFMTQEGLLATIPGATLYGVSSQDNETEWQQTYSAGGTNGTIEVIWDGEPSTSKWFVDGDQWCEDWGTDSACFRLVKVSDNELVAFRSGKQIRNSWFIK